MFLTERGEIVCGIAGFIGESRNPEYTHQLTTHMFAFLESRGKDAAGVYGATAGHTPKVIYHKEALTSSRFVELVWWHKLLKFNPNLLVLHARAASVGVGAPATNKNNHPFVSDDRTIGLAHNGRIYEYDFLKDKYETKTTCDSEILLRVYEHSRSLNQQVFDDFDRKKIENQIPEETEARVAAVKDIFTLVNRGHMAVAIGEVNSDRRNLMLFRNAHRPCWLVDLRESLGQIFFVSTPDIFYRAVNSVPTIKKFIDSTEKVFELPTNQLWMFRVDQKHPRIDVNIKNSYERFVFDRRESVTEEWKNLDYVRSNKDKQKYEVVTALEDDDSVDYRNRAFIPYTRQVEPKKTTTYSVSKESHLSSTSGSRALANWDKQSAWSGSVPNNNELSTLKKKEGSSSRLSNNNDEDTVLDDEDVLDETKFTLDDLESNINETRETINSIMESVKEMIEENSMSTQQYKEIVTYMGEVQDDLQTLVALLNS